MSRVLVTETGLGLVIGFINRLQMAATITYNMVPDLHNLKSLQMLLTHGAEPFSAFYGTRRFITVFTRALHWSLS
jgi:hypothetical protein